MFNQYLNYLKYFFIYQVFIYYELNSYVKKIFKKNIQNRKIIKINISHT